MNLLVVDDDSVIRMLLRTLLTSEGYCVATAADGEEALAKLVEHKFDLIICDVFMPVVDGVHLRRLVRAVPQMAHIPFLFISGRTDAYAAGVIQDHVLEGFCRKGKPFPALMSWVKYLTTPESKRSGLYPVEFEKAATKAYIHRRVDPSNTRAPLM